MAREVKIVVKNVYAPTEQQQFVLLETALVKELKQLVHAEFPGSPLPAHQKLIFGGKICADGEPLQTILNVNQVATDEDAAAVVFHLLVTSVPPRSRPSTPPASSEPAAASAPAPAPAAPVARIETDAAPSPADPAAVDSPRPAPAASAQAPPALNIGGGARAAAAPAFPAFGQFGGPGATAAAPQLDLFTQGMLLHQQALILSQIQYLQFLQRHAQHQPPQQQAPHPYAQYAQFGHYFGMGMHAAPLYHAVPGAAATAAAAASAAGVAAAATPAAEAAPRPVGLAVQIAREILPLFDLRLAMKMAFMLFIIGQDTPNDRVLMLALLSFISYLHITGILAKIYEVYTRRSAPAAADGANGAAAEANAGNNNNANNNGGGGAGGAAGGALARLNLARVLRISSDRGFVQDVRYFVVGFLLSLVPAWHPQPLQGGAAPAADPVQDLPDVAEMPVQGI